MHLWASYFNDRHGDILQEKLAFFVMELSLPHPGVSKAESAFGGATQLSPSDQSP